jgi:quercetin dioxygenase-like cupin family protein
MDERTRSTPPKIVTTGSATRPPRPLRPVFVDLDREAEALVDEPEWTFGDRNARTLAATDRIRVTLAALRPMAELGEAQTDEALTLHVLRGRVEVDVEGAEVDVRAGQAAVIDHPTSWRARATTDSVVLLTSALDGEGR